MKKRMRIRMLTFTIAAVLALSGATMLSATQAARYKARLNDGYQRALSDLTDCVDGIENTLNKSIYANTRTQQNGLAAKLMRETSMAKSALSTLPLTGTTLGNVGRYITQVGDFAMTLSAKVSAGQSISEKERAVLGDLALYSKNLKESMGAVRPSFEGEALDTDMKKTVEDFATFPSIIYDGPFSSHIGRQRPKLLEGMGDIMQGNAQGMAAEFLGTSTMSLEHTPDSAGNLPTYNFMLRDARISITKQGGIIADVLREREILSESLDFEGAKASALGFLKSRGVENLRETYYVLNDGMCSINFAYYKDGVTYYPDLVKLGVAMDNGQILEYNAVGYLMNHCKRPAPAPKVTQAQAAASLSPHLKAGEGTLAVIPTAGQGESLCWEFSCEGENNDHVLVYINAMTGFEEQILILTKGDGGMFVK